MNSEITASLAVWGAILGTANLGWNIWTASRNKARIVAKIECRDLGGEHFISFELRNQGTRSTTVEEIMLVKYSDESKECSTRENVSAKYRETAKLPTVLSPGELWKGHAPIAEEKSFTEIDKLPLIENGQLFYEIKCAHTDRLISGVVKPESF